MASRSPQIQAAYDEYRAQANLGCSFCALVQQATSQIISIYQHFMIVENRFPYAIWDSLRVEEHLMLVPLRHVVSLRDFSNDEGVEYLRLATDYEEKGYSLYSRSHSNSARTVAHQHTHLIKLDTTA